MLNISNSSASLIDIGIAMHPWFSHTPTIDRPNVTVPIFDDVKGLEDWLAQAEKNVPDIRTDCGAKLNWFQGPHKTPYSVVFVHGFSASPSECNPFPQKLALKLNANLYLARLKGHGRTPEAMLEGTLQGWLNDTATALQIGQQLGHNIIAIGCSTGAALLVLLAARYGIQPNMLCLISPSFANANRSSRLLEYRGRRLLLRLAMGPTRTWESSNPDVNRIWTNSYPSPAILPYIDTMRLLRRTTCHAITCPTLTFAAPQDQLVCFASAQRRLAEFSGPCQLYPIYTSEEPLQHNIVGSVLSPSTLDECLDKTLRFIQRTALI